VADKHGESLNFLSPSVNHLNKLTFETRVNNNLTWAAAPVAMDVMTRIRRYDLNRFSFDGNWR
jgi:hypothetical protein